MPKPTSIDRKKTKPPKITAQIQPEKRTSLLELQMLQSLQEIGVFTSEFTINEDSPATLPMSLWEKLAVVIVLSRVGLAAQNAQRVYGVPASFLIARFIVDYGYDGEPQAEDGERFMGEALLLSQAKELATSPTFSPALELAGSPVAYARRLCELGLRGRLRELDPRDDGTFYLLDLADLIVCHDLFQCDWRYRVLPNFHGRMLEVEEAAAILSESATSVRCLIESGDLAGRLYGGNDGRDFVVGSSIEGYGQRQLLQEIRGHSKGRSGPRGKLLDFASAIAPREPA